MRISDWSSDVALPICFHAHAKAVGTLAAGNGRLVGAFHGRSTKRTTSEGTCPTGSRPGRALAQHTAGAAPGVQKRNLLTDRIRKSPSFQQVFSALSNSYAVKTGTQQALPVDNPPPGKVESRFEQERHKKFLADRTEEPH